MHKYLSEKLIMQQRSRRNKNVKRSSVLVATPVNLASNFATSLNCNDPVLSVKMNYDLELVDIFFFGYVGTQSSLKSYHDLLIV